MVVTSAADPRSEGQGRPPGRRSPVMAEPPPLHGTVAPGFEEVRDAFAANFTARDELGAACAAYVGGEPVVDLWGGWRDLARTEPWQRDTLVFMFSTTTGMSASLLSVAPTRGPL